MSEFLSVNVLGDCMLELQVDPGLYHDACLYDLCLHDPGNQAVLCLSLEAYVRECASRGIAVDWRYDGFW